MSSSSSLSPSTSSSFDFTGLPEDLQMDIILKMDNRALDRFLSLPQNTNIREDVYKMKSQQNFTQEQLRYKTIYNTWEEFYKRMSGSKQDQFQFSLLPEEAQYQVLINLPQYEFLQALTIPELSNITVKMSNRLFKERAQIDFDDKLLTLAVNTAEPGETWEQLYDNVRHVVSLIQNKVIIIDNAILTRLFINKQSHILKLLSLINKNFTFSKFIYFTPRYKVNDEVINFFNTVNLGPIVNMPTYKFGDERFNKRQQTIAVAGSRLQEKLSFLSNNEMRGYITHLHKLFSIYFTLNNARLPPIPGQFVHFHIPTYARQLLRNTLYNTILYRNNQVRGLLINPQEIERFNQVSQRCLSKIDSPAVILTPEEAVRTEQENTFIIGRAEPLIDLDYFKPIHINYLFRQFNVSPKTADNNDDDDNENDGNGNGNDNDSSSDDIAYKASRKDKNYFKITDFERKFFDQEIAINMAHIASWNLLNKAIREQRRQMRN